MSVETTATHPRLSRVVLYLVGGALIGLVAATMAATLSAPLVLLALAALAMVLPTLVIRDFSRYWLWGYLFLLPVEASKRVTNLSADLEVMIDTVGLPPSTYLGVKIFPADLLLVALLIHLVFSLKLGKRSFHFPKPAYLLVAYLVWTTLASLLKAQSPSLAVAQLVLEYKFLVAFLFFVNVLRTPSMIRFVTRVLLATLVLEIIVTLSLYGMNHTRDSLAERLNLGVSHEYDFLRGQEKSLHEEIDSNFKASGTFGAASHLAMYLQLLFPFPLALAATARDLKWRILFSALYLFSALSLYVTQSRAGLIGLIAGTGACFLLLRFRRHVGRRAFLALAYTGLAFAALQVPIVYNHMASRPHTYWHRFNLFREAAKIIVANPVLGVGANNSTAARLRYAAPSPYESVSATGIAFDFDNLYPIHSQYLVVAAETGLVGFALGASFFLFMASEAMRLSKSENAFHSTLAIAVVSGYVALGCQLLADHFVGNAQHTTLALSTALIVAIGRLDSDAADLPLPSAPSCL